MIGLALAVPLSVLASIIVEPDFPDVDGKAWYADGVYTARQAGWMSGYPDGNFGPGNSVLRGELATVLTQYDKNLEEMHDQLKTIICSNKGNSLDSLGLQIVDSEKYSKALKGFCGGQWPTKQVVGCLTPYNPKTGVYDTQFTRCP